MNEDLVCILLVTTPADAARPLADHILDRRLAACVNRVDGVSSTFWWQGKRDEATETLLVVKTTKALVDRAIAVIVEVHPYEVPEVIALPVVAGHGPYLDWVRSEATG